jgi:hypothetical protein
VKHRGNLHHLLIFCSWECSILKNKTKNISKLKCKNRDSKLNDNYTTLTVPLYSGFCQLLTTIKKELKNSLENNIKVRPEIFYRILHRIINLCTYKGLFPIL